VSDTRTQHFSTDGQWLIVNKKVGSSPEQRRVNVDFFVVYDMPPDSLSLPVTAKSKFVVVVLG